MNEHHKHTKKPHRAKGSDGSQGNGANSANEGEGSRTAAHDYNREVQSFIASDRVEPAAREAKQFVDEQPEAAAKAERDAAAGPHPIMHRLEELATEGRAMFNRTVSRVRARLRR